MACGARVGRLGANDTALSGGEIEWSTPLGFLAPVGRSAACWKGLRI